MFLEILSVYTWYSGYNNNFRCGDDVFGDCIQLYMVHCLAE